MNASKPAGPVLAIIGGIVTALAAFLAWATVSLSGTVDVAGQQLPVPEISESISGINSTDGKITVVAGILGVILGLVAMSRSGSARRGLGIIIILAGLVAGGFGIYDTVQANNLASNAADEIRNGVSSSIGVVPPEQQAQVDDLINQMIDKLDISVGIGLYLTIAGGVLLLIGGILTMAGAAASDSASSGGGAAWAPPAAGGTPPPPPPAGGAVPPPAATPPPPVTPPPATPPPATPADGGPTPPA